MKLKLLLFTLFSSALFAYGETLPGMDFSPDGRYNIGNPTFDRPGNIYVKGNIYSGSGSITSGYATTATAAGTTTLTNASAGTQFFTGSTTQILKLPVASTMTLGQSFLVENNSTGAVTVNSSGSNAVLVMAALTRARFTCILTSGTTAASWDAFYEATNEATGKVVTFDHTSTFTTTDGQTYTFPTTSATLARTDAANTFTGVQTMTSPAITTPAFTGTSTGTYSLGGTVTIVSPIVSTGLTASGSASNDFSASTGTFKTSTGANTIGGATTFPAGTATAGTAPIYLQSGTLLTAAAAGAVEEDGAAQYFTTNTTEGRAAAPNQQYFRLTSNGGTISTIANYFGTTSNISLVSSGFYEIDIYAYFLNSTSGTVVWTLTNTAAPTSQNIYYEMSPASGVVAPPGTATMLVGQIVNDATAAKALTATAALTDAVNHFMHMKIWLQNSTGTSLKIQATKSAGSITPLVGSYWTCKRLPAASTGTFSN